MAFFIVIAMKTSNPTITPINYSAHSSLQYNIRIKGNWRIRLMTSLPFVSPLSRKFGILDVLSFTGFHVPFQA
jgi:hypothetical protein